jgi:hypothetical protein
MNFASLGVIAPCCQYVNRRFGRTYNLLQAAVLLGYLLTSNIEDIWSSETSIYIQTTRRCIPEDGNFQYLPILKYFGQKVIRFWRDGMPCTLVKYFLFSRPGYFLEFKNIFGSFAYVDPNIHVYGPPLLLGCIRISLLLTEQGNFVEWRLLGCYAVWLL